MSLGGRSWCHFHDGVYVETGGSFGSPEALAQALVRGVEGLGTSRESCDGGNERLVDIVFDSGRKGGEPKWFGGPFFSGGRGCKGAVSKLGEIRLTFTVTVPVTTESSFTLGTRTGNCSLCRSFIISMRTAKQDQERYQQQ